MVRPFIPAHVDWLVHDMATWNLPEFAPCEKEEGKWREHEEEDGSRVDRLLAEREKPDLVLYFSYPLEEFPEVVRTLRGSWATAPWRECFARVRIISAGLNASADRYLPNQKMANSSKEEDPEQQKRPAPSGTQFPGS